MVGPFEVCEYFLALCLGALQANGRPAPTRAYVGAGEIAWDDWCGQLVVTSERVFRADAFPDEYTTVARCDGDTIGVEILVEHLHCVPSPNAKGQPPPVASMAAAHASIYLDDAVLWNALNGDWLGVDWERALLNRTFRGNQGGAVATQFRFFVGIDAVEWCLI